jgi:hypothetical protein
MVLAPGTGSSFSISSENRFENLRASLLKSDAFIHRDRYFQWADLIAEARVYGPFAVAAFIKAVE